MADPKYRKNRRDAVNGGNRAIDLSYNDRAGALKCIGRVMGELTIKGIGVGPHNCELGDTIAFYNNSTVTAFVAFANTPGALPGTVDATNGIALPPNDYVVLTSGNNNWYKASAATVLSYSINDETYLG
jgi:hypothetical protein